MSAVAAEVHGIGNGRTVGRLLRGNVRRSRAQFLAWLWMLPMMSLEMSKRGVGVEWLMAASMAVAFLVRFTEENIGCREHRILPVSDRDFWIAIWLNATLVVPAYLFLLKGLGIALAAASGRNFLTPEALLLSTLYDVVYASAMLLPPLLIPNLASALAVPFGVDSLPAGSPQRHRVALLTVIGVSLVVPLFIIIGIGVPFLFVKSLPVHVADWSPASLVSLGVGVAMSVAALLRTPPRGGTTPLIRAAAATPVEPAKPVHADRLTGIRAVAWIHVKSTFIRSAIGIALSLAVLPWLPPSNGNSRFAIDLFLIFAMMVISSFSVWANWTRQLKVLPMTVRKVNALFVLTPLLTWTVTWILLLLVHAALALRVPVELSPWAVLLYAGLCAFSHALGLWLKGSAVGQTTASMVGVMAACAMAMWLFDAPDFWTPWLLLIVALSSFAVAAFINHLTLTRSTSSARLYRPLGLSMKP